MKKIMISASLGLAIALSACQTLTSSTEIVADTILASQSIDSMKTDFAPYVDDKQALVELADLQADILTTFSTGENFEQIFSYRLRALIVYETLSKYAVDNWGLMTDEQQASLIALDNQLISINSAIDDLESSSGVGDELLGLIYDATVLMSYYKIF